MAFLDNSGDIILDAVLTDAGRFRMAKGDGSFKIVKYAFADDEIDYSKYNKDHLSGSAYYDLDVLKTPVLEAFTNNTSNMKHRLLSIPRTNLLYIPVLMLNEVENKGGSAPNDRTVQAENFFVVCVDENTEEEIIDSNTKIGGIIKGVTNPVSKLIICDQGLNTDAISFSFSLDSDLVETRYIIQLDHRLGTIVTPANNTRAPNFIDDDNVASYTVSIGNDSGMIGDIGKDKDSSPILGPRGTRLSFTIAPSVELNSSTFLFTKLGTTNATFQSAGGTNKTVHHIDTTVRVTGGSTGRSLDIPVRFVKYVSG